MKKKIAFLFLAIFLIGLFLPLVSLAGEYQAKEPGPGGAVVDVCYEGLVPCGIGKELWRDASFENGQCTPKSDANLIQTIIRDPQGKEIGEYAGVKCQFCHFFVMLNGIFEFVLVYIVPPIAVLMLVVGGVMFYFAGGSPGLVTRGKSLIKNVIIGLVLAYGAFLIVGTVLSIIGLAAPWESLEDIATQGITIECDIELPQ